VYVEAKNGNPTNFSQYKAWDGFRWRQFKTALIESEQILEGRVPLTPDVLVVGGLRCLREVFRQLRVALPVFSDLPECLLAYRGRRVWHSTLGQLRIETRSNGSLPIFFKPLGAWKLFPAQILTDSNGLQPFENLPDDTGVLVSDCVHFLSEWRCFVCQGRIFGLSHYEGDCLLYPDASVVRGAIDDFRQDAPAAYAIDFGITADGRTLLVEVNNGYALGSYGLRPLPYSEMLEAWWLEQICARAAS
jgi:hypothetical protein